MNKLKKTNKGTKKIKNKKATNGSRNANKKNTWHDQQ